MDLQEAGTNESNALFDNSRAVRDSAPTLLEIERSGDWMPVEELRQAAVSALAMSSDVNLNLDKFENLEADALQVLLALERELERLGRKLLLVNVSSQLLKWFEYAGAVDQFVIDGRRGHQ